VSYYTGDPGFFSIFKSIGSFAASFIPGIGGVASKAISKIPLPVRAAAGSAMRVTKGAIIKHPVLSAAGAAGGVGAAALMHGRKGAGGMAGPGGAMLGRRHRRMRVTNPKALRRALRRAHGFAKLAMKTIHLVHPRKKVRFGGFKHRRRK
jgi:hypothetical protein